MAQPYEDITLQLDDEIAVLTLNRPEVRNALRHQTFAEIEDAVLHLSARVLIVTGADPAFCSGDDVRAIMGAGEVRERRRHTPRLTPAADALLFTDIPVIAAVNGAAVGWGMELALMADFRILSERARFGELFVRRGLVSDPAGLGRLAQLVGREKAAELLMTGDIIDAAEACRSDWPAGWCRMRNSPRQHGRWPAESRRTRRLPSVPSRMASGEPLIPTGRHSAGG